MTPLRTAPGLFAALLLTLISAVPAAASDDERFAAIALPALDACVARLAEGADEEGRACLAPMMAICVRARAEGQPVEALRACIEDEIEAWRPVIESHFSQVEAGGDVKALTRNEMMRTLASDIIESRCPQLAENGVSDAFCELRATGSLAIDLRLDMAREAAAAQ